MDFLSVTPERRMGTTMASCDRRRRRTMGGVRSAGRYAEISSACAASGSKVHHLVLTNYVTQLLERRLAHRSRDSGGRRPRFGDHAKVRVRDPRSAYDLGDVVEQPARRPPSHEACFAVANADRAELVGAAKEEPEADGEDECDDDR